MTRKEFEQLRCGDKVYDKVKKQEGIIMVASVGEIYVQYPDNEDFLISYDPIEDGPHCYYRLQKNE